MFINVSVNTYKAGYVAKLHFCTLYNDKEDVDAFVDELSRLRTRLGQVAS
ncbi:MAG: hypothetical protein ACP5KA_07645 [Desulfurococcaceae archaeon]